MLSSICSSHQPNPALALPKSFRDREPQGGIGGFHCGGIAFQKFDTQFETKVHQWRAWDIARQASIGRALPMMRSDQVAKTTRSAGSAKALSSRVSVLNNSLFGNFRGNRVACWRSRCRWIDEGRHRFWISHSNIGRKPKLHPHRSAAQHRFENENQAFSPSREARGHCPIDSTQLARAIPNATRDLGGPISQHVPSPGE